MKWFDLKNESKWGLKATVEYWLDCKGITNCSVKTLGRGHHGVIMYIFEESVDDFLIKYPSLETGLYKGSFTKDRYCEGILYISMTLKKLRT